MFSLECWSRSLAKLCYCEKLIKTALAVSFSINYPTLLLWTQSSPPGLIWLQAFNTREVIFYLEFAVHHLIFNQIWSNHMHSDSKKSNYTIVILPVHLSIKLTSCDRNLQFHLNQSFLHENLYAPVQWQSDEAALLTDTFFLIHMSKADWWLTSYYGRFASLWHFIREPEKWLFEEQRGAPGHFLVGITNQSHVTVHSGHFFFCFVFVFEECLDAVVEEVLK